MAHGFRKYNSLSQILKLMSSDVVMNSPSVNLIKSWILPVWAFLFLNCFSKTITLSEMLRELFAPEFPES